MYKPLIVIPFYNHFQAFNQFAKKLQTLSYPILVINDGSSDSERAHLKTLCSNHQFHYIEHIQNQGKGGAVLSGIAYALANGYTHVIQIDADGQHEYKDIKKFIELSKNNPTKIINGAPIYDNSIPKARLYGRKITQFWVWVETFGADIIDTMCGFRVYPIKELDKIIPKIRFKRMGFDTEIIVKCYLNGINIINLPTKVKYLKNGVSHFNCLKDNIEITWMHTQLCCYALYKIITLKWRKNV